MERLRNAGRSAWSFLLHLRQSQYQDHLLWYATAIRQQRDPTPFPTSDDWQTDRLAATTRVVSAVHWNRESWAVAKDCYSRSMRAAAEKLQIVHRELTGTLGFEKETAKRLVLAAANHDKLRSAIFEAWNAQTVCDSLLASETVFSASQRRQLHEWVDSTRRILSVVIHETVTTSLDVAAVIENETVAREQLEKSLFCTIVREGAIVEEAVPLLSGANISEDEDDEESDCEDGDDDDHDHDHDERTAKPLAPKIAANIAGIAERNGRRFAKQEAAAAT